MYTFEVLADACYRAGARRLFTIMGDGNKRWLVAAARRGIALHHVRHEGAALAMADGYARVTGEVGVCSVTYSAGLTQLCTSLMVAARHRTPLLVVAGDLPSAQRGFGSQIDIDEAALVRASGAIPIPVRSPASAATDMHIAMATARRQQCPVVLLAPLDIQESEAPTAPAAGTDGLAAAAWLAAPGSPAPPEAVTAAAQVIAASRRPVLLAGRGAVAAGAREAICRLADRLGSLLATTLPAKGYLDHDPHSLGIAGSFSDQRARQLFAMADCVIAVGASLSAYTLAEGELFPEAAVVQVDSAPDGPALSSYDLAAHRRAPVPVPGDAAIVLGQLLETVPEAAPAPWRQDEKVQELLRRDPRREAIDNRPASLARGTSDPRELMLALDRALPASAEVVIGVGNFTWFPVQFLRNPGNRRFLSTIDFVAIGQAVPTAIGAALGTATAPVVAFEGDASFMMHVQELETAARYGVPMLVFVLNDGALGAEYHKLKAAGVDVSETILPSADICEVAAAFGVRARRVTHQDQVPEVIEWFNPDEGPHVVDCPISRSVVGPS